MVVGRKRRDGMDLNTKGVTRIEMIRYLGSRGMWMVQVVLLPWSRTVCGKEVVCTDCVRIDR